MDNQKIEKMLPVFVYGTLMNDFGNYNRNLKGVTIAEHAALTTGMMFSVHDAYPALIKDPKADKAIKGELMFIAPHYYRETLRGLDWLEGYRETWKEQSLYIREKAIIFDESEGKQVEAWVYYWNGSLNGLRVVESGSWREYLGAEK